MSFQKGRAKTGGKVKGQQNKTTTEFKQALNNLLEYCAPKMAGWLEKVAKEDPNKALDHMGKLAEYCYPKLARSETKHEGELGLTINIKRFSDGNRPSGQ